MTQKVITRDWLHPNLKWYGFDANDNSVPVCRADLDAGIDHWKNIIREITPFPVGAKMGPCLSQCDNRYLTLLFATLELGGQIAVLDRPSTPDGVPQCRFRVNAPLDLFVINQDNWWYDVFTAMGQAYGKTVIDLSIWFDYVAKDTSPASEFLATPENIALIATTSGSTGTPKPITYTHKFMHDLGRRCQRVFDFKSDDRLLHLSNIHHGGSTGTFFLPSLASCEHHFFEYGLNDARFDFILDLVHRERISKIVFPNTLMADKFIKNIKPLQHRLDLYTLQANLKSWIPEVRRANINSITSIFGSVETAGPIFTNVITPDTPDDFDVLNFGRLLDDFYQVELTTDHKLKVNITSRDSQVLNDQFTLDQQGNYHFVGRSDLVRVNDVQIPMSMIEHLARNTFHQPAYLVPDSVTNKIYLLCDSSITTDELAAKLPKINHELSNISYMLKVDYYDFQPAQQFVDNIKLNPVRVRDHFRSKFNLT